MQEAILTVNAGSSNIKFAFFEVFGHAVPAFSCQALCRGIVEQQHEGVQITMHGAAGAKLVDEKHAGNMFDYTFAIKQIYRLFETHFSAYHFHAAGHRVVHGGSRYYEPVQVSEDTLQELEELVPLAPLHQPHNLSAIRIFAELLPGLAQVACFDTAFHRSQSEITQLFALPYDLYKQGIRRYGFHGISYEYIAGVLPDYMDPTAAEGRIIVAHLGNGASICGIRNRQSVATTMGFSPLDGIPMGTRPGSVDPGVLLYLMEQKKMDVQQLSALLYRQSGLLGISGISNDMRQLLKAKTELANKAVDVFVYRIIREIGSLMAALSGLDHIVFTGGIGENSSEIRDRICKGLRWLHVELNDQANMQSKAKISSESSQIGVWVIPTDEETMIARHTVQITSGR